jgi:uncharacterized LabA/DUF88 family protein
LTRRKSKQPLDVEGSPCRGVRPRRQARLPRMQPSGTSGWIVSVAAFVDWNSQLLLTGRDSSADPEGVAELALRQTTRRIARCLADFDSGKRFRVGLRLYHGWHKGYEPTVNRKAAQVVVGRADFATLSQRPTVVSSPNVGFGDRLTSALDRRLHARLAIHLPNTMRKRYSEVEEKMVDTALAADVVSTAYREAGDWILVVTEDDDLIPSIYVAEAALLGSSSKVILLRKRAQASMMILDDLLVSG